MTRLRTLVAMTMAAAIGPSCISANYSRVSTGEPIGDARMASIKPGRADLGSCLAQLGAPNLVWTSEDGNLSMAYAWVDRAGWGLSLSYAFDQFVGASASITSTDLEVQSVVLAFDESLRLLQVSRGYLWDLAPSAQASSPTQRMLQNTPR